VQGPFSARWRTPGQFVSVFKQLKEVGVCFKNYTKIYVALFDKLNEF
jgi:hypothetical protein